MIKIPEILKHPNLALRIVLWVAASTMLAVSLCMIFFDITHIVVNIALVTLACLLYVYAAYSTVKRYGIDEKLLEKAAENKLLHKIVNNYNLRTVVFACGSILLDFCFSAVGLITGITSGSEWFVANGTYYFMLTAIRLWIIIWSARNIGDDELGRTDRFNRIYAACAIALFILNTAFATLFDTMLDTGEGFVKSKIIIYATSVFTFFKVVLAVRGFIKTRKAQNLVVRSLRNISVVTAFASVLMLITSLYSTFPSLPYSVYVIGITTNAVSIFTVILSIIMLVQSFIYNRSLEKARAAEAEKATDGDADVSTEADNATNDSDKKDGGDNNPPPSDM